MIIDAHCHAGKGDGFNGPWDTDADLTRYLARAKACGIRRTVLWSALHSDYAVANRQVARIRASDPKRFYAFAFVNAARDRDRMMQMVSTLVRRHGFCGIKVHRHDAPIHRTVGEVARRLRVPVVYDCMGQVAVVELLAREYPDVAWIIPHLGSFGDDWAAQRALIDHLARHPNIYTDTAGVRRFDLLEEAVVRGGAHKILFGSDGPWLHPGVELSKVHALSVTEGQRRLILGGNFLRLIRRVRR